MSVQEEIEENLKQAKEKIDGRSVADRISRLEDRIDELEDQQERRGREEYVDQKFSELEEKIEQLDGSLVDDLEEQLEQAEVHETERIDSLESKVEKLRIDLQNESIHEKAAEKRLAQIEDRLENLESGNSFDDRLSELEDNVIDLSETLDERVDRRIEERFEAQKDATDIERDLADLESQVVKLTEIVKDELVD